MIPPEHNLGFSIASPDLDAQARGRVAHPLRAESALESLEAELERAVDVPAEAEGAGQLHLDEAGRPRGDQACRLERGIRPPRALRRRAASARSR